MIGFRIIVLAVGTGLATAASAAVPRERTFELTYNAVVEVPAGARRVEVWIPYPVSDENQEVTVTEISSPLPTKITRDQRFGNALLHLSAGDPMPTEIPVSLTIRVTRREYVRNQFAQAKAASLASRPAAVERWLEPERRVALDERIRSLAAQVTDGKRSDLEKIRALYDYVVETMTYDKSGTGWGNGDIYWACDAKRGNCTDFHALFTGLARAVGIPARFEIGFSIPAERGSGEVAGYHCWAQFYLDGYGWVPVDASEARKNPDRRDYFFGAHDENRVLFSLGRDLVLSPRQQGEPINFLVYPYVEVDGKPHLAVTRTFRYRDLPGGEMAAQELAAIAGLLLEFHLAAGSHAGSTPSGTRHQ